jgi:hypothetical protein
MTIRDPYDELEETRVEDDGDRVREVRIREDKVAMQQEATSKVVTLIILADWALQALIGMRVFLKAIAANPSNPFANFIYTLSELFVWPFNGLTVTPSAEGFAFDLPAIVAMVVYALAGWLLARFIGAIFHRRRTTRISTYERD